MLDPSPYELTRRGLWILRSLELTEEPRSGPLARQRTEILRQLRQHDPELVVAGSAVVDAAGHLRDLAAGVIRPGDRATYVWVAGSFTARSLELRTTTRSITILWRDVASAETGARSAATTIVLLHLRSGPTVRTDLGAARTEIDRLLVRAEIVPAQEPEGCAYTRGDRVLTPDGVFGDVVAVVPPGANGAWNVILRHEGRASTTWRPEQLRPASGFGPTDAGPEDVTFWDPASRWQPGFGPTDDGPSDPSSSGGASR